MTRFQPRPVRSISVLMPTWQGEEFLERVLKALAAQDCPLPWDFAVVDSGSRDRTLEILESWRARFPVPMRVQHLHQSAFDHGDTRNLLAAESSGDLLVFLTQDAIPSDSRWLATLARNFEDPAVAAAYCRNLPRPDAQILTRVFSELDPGYTAGRREVRLPERAQYDALDAHQRRVLYNFNDVASAVRRDVWELHPFPRTEFGEDVLLARGLLEAGFTVVYDDVATVEHSHDYGPAEMRKRAAIDGKFNAEWLDRVCVGSRSDAEVLTKRQLERDREALSAAGVRGAELETQLRYAEELRRAAFVGLFEGGTSKRRFPATRMLERTKLRVLYVVHGFPPDTWAGTEVYTLGLALEMQRRGHEVVILTRAPAAKSVEDGGPADFSLEPGEFSGLAVWRMTHRLQHANLRESYHQPRAEAAFREVLLKVKPDLVHFQHLIHMSANLPAVAREYGLPTVITVNDFWALCARVQLIRPDGVRCEENQGLGCLLCVKDKNYKQIPAAKQMLPVLEPIVGMLGAAAHVPGMAQVAQYAGEFRDMAERHEFACAGYAASDLVIAPSRFLRQKLLDTGKFDAHRVLYSDYGTLTDNIRAIERRPDERGRLRIGYVGSLLWYKGVDVLVRAMKELAGKPLVLHVYGEFKPDKDAYHAQLAELARECGDAVVFHGRFDNHKIASVYEQIDVLAVPSTWFENSPITIHESFLFETPIVTSNIGGMAELVRDGVDGLHFEVGDAHDLAAKLARLVDEPALLGSLKRFRHIKTMSEDAREMEVRYRGLCCVRRESSATLLLDKRGVATLARSGPVEQQGAELALLRPGGAYVEYDASTCGPGRIEIEVELETLAGESSIALGGTLSLDGRELGQIEPFHAGDRGERRVFRFSAELAAPAQRLRLDTRTPQGEVYLRVARLRVSRALASLTCPPRAS
ncbi:MAG: glycosyltransferase [Planctomycetes bacterium]|nr:glycosyltransferase [Planctomycetota bacterium]